MRSIIPQPPREENLRLQELRRHVDMDFVYKMYEVLNNDLSSLKGGIKHGLRK